MNQQSLFAEPPSAQLPPHCRSRRDDPESSRLAGASHEASGKAGSHRAIIAEALARWRGRTSAELAWLIDLDRHEVARRLPELERAGVARKGAVRKCEQNGSQAVTWWPQA